MKTKLLRVFTKIKHFFKDNKEYFQKIITASLIAGFILAMFISLVVPLSAAGDPTENPDVPAVPSDLTGYTVTVPAGWTASSGYGLYSIEGSVTKDYLVEIVFSLNIGYWYGTNDGESWGLLPDSNAINVDNNYNIYGDSLVFTFTGGDDVDNSSLIQWLVANNASFVNNNPTPDPDPDPDPDPPQSDYDRGYEDGFNEGFGIGVTEGNEQGYNVGYYDGFEQGQTEGYNSGLEEGRSEGYDSGVEQGYDMGYEDGYLIGYSSAQAETSGNFFADIIGSVVKALDNFVIFGEFSLLDLFTTLLGGMALVWILKLLAGG